MAMAAGGSKGLENDINVTPMIDVLLVLLIIFMAALPSMRKAIDIQLPDPNPQTVPANQNSNQIVLEVLPGGVFSINTEKVDKVRLGPRLKEIYDPRPEKIIFVKGDPAVKYQDVIEAMDIARGSGVKVIGVPPKDLGDKGAGGAAPAAPSGGQ
ncbi:MAG TPA: biopolymer transporter ExbD [Gemmatimonadaceae bacterium]|nr:biopolymer transporter ExbD [Gemmatimonadaceae bacterium]